MSARSSMVSIAKRARSASIGALNSDPRLTRGLAGCRDDVREGCALDRAAMRFDVVTLFPELVLHASGFGITGRARERGLWSLATVNPRDFAQDAHRSVDDRPYGGGPGMVMLAEPLAAALAVARAAQRDAGCSGSTVIHLSPAGQPLTHARVMQLATQRDAGYVLLAGRYEGIDERLIAREVDCEIAIGDFVVSGGELPALMLIDAIVRQLPGAMNG